MSSYKQRWLSVVSPLQEHKLPARLKLDGLTEDEFFKSISSPPDTLPNNDSTEIKKCIVIVEQELKKHWNKPLLAPDSSEKRAFVDLWTPLEDYCSDYIHSFFSCTNHLVSQSAIIDLTQLLISRLVDLSDRVLWDEFLKNRPAGFLFASKTFTGLESETPRKYYQDFIFQHRKDSLLALFNSYPVFRYFVGVAFKNWISFVQEFCTRLINDRNKIFDVFSLHESYILTGIEGDLSDPHRGGRSVLVLSFSDPSQSTSNKKVVYKPKSLELEKAYYSFLAFLNSQSSSTPFKILNILCCDDYGFVEFICRDHPLPPTELPVFYTMAGRLAAVFYLIGCTDCHHENLIASSGQLVLVDAETIFDSPLNEGASSDPSGAFTELDIKLFRSLLTSGFVPYWTHYGAFNRPVDLSALGILSPDEGFSLQDGWVSINTDYMSAGQISVPNHSPTTLPCALGTNNPAFDYSKYFLAGFNSQSHQFMELKDILLDDNGFFSGFKQYKRRHLVRATQTYYSVQRQQFAPQALSSFFEQSLVLERLSRSFLDSNISSQSWPIYKSEFDQMMNLDIPMFEHFIGSNLIDTHLNETAVMNLPDSYLSVLNRLSSLDECEISFHTMLIKGAFEASNLHVQRFLPASSFADQPKISPSSTSCRDFSISNFLLESLTLLVRSTHISSHDRCQWLGYNLHSSDVYSFYPSNTSLFSGISSLPLLINHTLSNGWLSELFDSDSKSALIKGKDSSIATLRYMIDLADDSQRFKWWRDYPLGLNGCGGVLLTLSLISELDSIDKLFIPQLHDLIAKSPRVSLLQGSAGLLGPLLSVGTDQSHQTARYIASNIAHKISSLDLMNAYMEEFPFSFFHGSSGIIASLAAVHSIHPDPTYEQAINSLLAYERSFSGGDLCIPPVIHQSLFSSGTTNSSDSLYSLDLYHGLTGIILSRICLYGTAFFDKTCLDELERFTGFLVSHVTLMSGINLSHGLMGPLAVAEFLLYRNVPITPLLRDKVTNMVKCLKSTVFSTYSLSDADFYPSIKLSTVPLGFFNGLLGPSLYATLQSNQPLFFSLLTGGLFRTGS